jgi:predicted O-methyltransferase YrrM
VEVGATATLEVGLAYGFSTVYLLAALEANGGGTHVAIDPYQDTDWSGVGVTTAARLVRGSTVLTDDAFRHIPTRSERALVDLGRNYGEFGLTFIDGYHRFDDVLVDFTLAAPMCPVGSVIVLHDMWLDSIFSVASFLRTNRCDFQEIQTGCENLFAVKRVDEDTRNWDHFVPFAMRPVTAIR